MVVAETVYAGKSFQNLKLYPGEAQSPELDVVRNPSASILITEKKIGLFDQIHYHYIGGWACSGSSSESFSSSIKQTKKRDDNE